MKSALRNVVFVIMVACLISLAGYYGNAYYRAKEEIRIYQSILALPCWVTHPHLRKGVAIK